MAVRRISTGPGLEAALRDLGQKLAQPGTLRVGFLENATYPDGTSVAMVAAIQDGGAPNAGIPPRPFFRNMVAEKKGEWPGAIAGLLKTTNYDTEQALRQAGEAIAGQLKQAIVSFKGVPLKPETVRRKGFDKALVDTGVMLGSVDFEVTK